MPNAEQRVGAGKFRNALYGRDQFGMKMSEEDRRKLLNSGAHDIVAGNKKAKQKEANAESYVDRAERYALMTQKAFSGEYDEPMTGNVELDNEIRTQAAKDTMVGVPEAALTIGSSILADIPAGYTGLMAMGRGKGPEAAEAVQNALTYQPRSEAGKRVLSGIGNALSTVLEPATRAADYYLQEGTEAGIRPSMLAIPLTALTAGLEMMPTKGAGAAERSAGRFVRMAEQYADEAAQLGPLSHDITAGSRASVLRDAPDADMSRVAQDVPEMRWNEAVPETGAGRYSEKPLGQTEAGAGQRGSIEATGGGKGVLKTQAQRNALTNTAGFAAEDKPRIPEYEAAEHPKPTAKAKHEFSGAPKNSPLLGGRDVASKADEQVLIDHYLSQAEAGVDGRLWYDEIAARFDRDVGNVSGARPGAADQHAAVFGDYSAGTAVPQNRLAQVRANNQFATGNPIEAGTPQRNADALQIYSESAVNPETKLKTGLFGMQTRGIPTSRGTHDFRDAINWGYDVTDSAGAGKVIGEAQHRWMDDMADRAVEEANKRKLGGYDDWTWDRLQAAGWVKQKADAKGVSVAEMANELENTDNWLRANVYHEAIPSGELVDMNAMNDLDKRAYTASYASKTANAEGQNALAHQTGMLSPEQTQFVGEWGNKLNPNIVTTILADPAKGASIISSWSDEAVKFNGALNGLLGGQADVAYSFLRPEKTKGNINSYRVPLGRTVKEADLSSYTNATRKSMREADAKGDVVYNRRSDGELEVTYIPPDSKKHPDWDRTAQLAEEAKGVKAKDRTPEQKAAVKAVNDEMEKFRNAIEGVSNERAIAATNSGGLITWLDEYKPSAWLEHLQNPKMRAAVESVIPKIAADIRRDIKALPLTKEGKEIYGKTLELLESGGLAAVEKAVKNGTLPAAVLGALLYGANQDPSRPEQGQGRRQPMTEG